MTAVVLSSTLAGYAGARVQGWSSDREAQVQLQIAVQEHERAIAHARSEHIAEVTGLRYQLRRAQTQLGRAEDLNVLYEGERQLHGALRALRQQNPQTAQQALREIERSLGTRAPRVPGLQGLLTRLASTNVMSAADATQHEEAIEDLIRELDGVVDGEAAEVRRQALHLGPI